MTRLALFLGLPLAALVESSLAVGGRHSFEAYRALTRPTAALLATPWEAVLKIEGRFSVGRIVHTPLTQPVSSFGIPKAMIARVV